MKDDKRLFYMQDDNKFEYITDVKISEKIILNDSGACGIVLSPSPDEKDMEKVNQLYLSKAIIPQQTHSANVGIARNRNENFPDTDALITFIPELPIGVRTADCVPIIVYAPDIKGVAAIHAGWKGTLKGIVDETINILKSYGAKTSEMIVAFGPSISKEIYEVDKPLADLFKEKGFSCFISYPKGKDSKPHLDLQGINNVRLIRLGLKPGNIRLSSFCTLSSRDQYNRPIFQSYRRDGTSAGRNLTIVALRQSLAPNILK